MAPALSRVLAHLAANPADVALSRAALAEKCSVSETTAAKGLAAFTGKKRPNGRPRKWIKVPVEEVK